MSIKNIKNQESYLQFLLENGYADTTDAFIEYLSMRFKKDDQTIEGRLLMEIVYKLLDEFKSIINLKNLDLTEDYDDYKSEFIMHLVQIRNRFNYSYKNGNRFEAYLYKCFKNWLMDKFRALDCSKRNFNNPKNKITMENNNFEKGRPDIMCGQLDITVIRSLVKSFQPGNLNYFDLLFIEELSVKDVATKMGVTIHTVYYHQNQLKEFLRSNVVKDRIHLLWKN